MKMTVRSMMGSEFIQKLFNHGPLFVYYFCNSMTELKRIAIFASGSGSNAQKVIEHFDNSTEAEVTIILSNRPHAYVLERADNHEIPTHVFDREEFYGSDKVVNLLKSLQIDLVVL